MNRDERIPVMREKLQAAFSPAQLEIIDDSAKHKGHAGAAGGAGHYTIILQAEYFTHYSRVDAHREIYRVLADLIPHEIHALSIKLIK